MIPTKKSCPSCYHRFTVDPVILQSICPECDTAYRVRPALSDTPRTRGGFTICLLYGDAFHFKLLDFIFENPRTSAHDCSMKFKKSRSKIRGNVRQLEAEDLVIIDRSGKPHRYSCSEFYVPYEKLAESKNEKICVLCGKKTTTSKKGKCQDCISQQKLIYVRFKELNRIAEDNINAMQRCKNSVTA
jgi:hypothetical protein